MRVFPTPKKAMGKHVFVRRPLGLPKGRVDVGNRASHREPPGGRGYSAWKKISFFRVFNFDIKMYCQLRSEIKMTAFCP